MQVSNYLEWVTEWSQKLSSHIPFSSVRSNLFQQNSNFLTSWFSAFKPHFFIIFLFGFRTKYSVERVRTTSWNSFRPALDSGQSTDKLNDVNLYPLSKVNTLSVSILLILFYSLVQSDVSNIPEVWMLSFTSS